ncbi:MAG: cobalt ECF transporter T component CbiQ [Gloeomargarita sp. DG02_4_bins_56]
MHHHLDVYAYGNALRPLPPAQKLGFALVMLLLAGVGHPGTQMGIVVWMSVWIVGYARIPAGVYGRLVAGMLLFWLSTALILLIQVSPTAPGLPVGGWFLSVSAAGVRQAWLSGWRVLAAGVCLLFIVLTVPFAEVLQVLRRWRLPPLLLDLLLLMYRLIFLLLDEVEAMQLAQRARAGDRTWWRRLYSMGLLVSQLAVRCLRRYQVLQLGLAARGFTGTLRVEVPMTYRASPRYWGEALLGITLLVWVDLYGRT